MKDLSMKIILWENNAAYLYMVAAFPKDLIGKVKIYRFCLLNFIKRLSIWKTRKLL